MTVWRAERNEFFTKRLVQWPNPHRMKVPVVAGTRKTGMNPAHSALVSRRLCCGAFLYGSVKVRAELLTRGA